MIIKPLGFIDLQKIEGTENKNRENIVIAINNALIDAKKRKKNLVLKTSEHCGVTKVMIHRESFDKKLTEFSPETGDFDEVIILFQKEWGEKLIKTQGGLEYTFLIF